MPFPPPAPPPALHQNRWPAAQEWWHQVGSPALTPFGDLTFRLFGTPYVQEGYYVDVPALRRRAPFSRESALRWLMNGDVASGLHMRFLIEISARKREAFLTKSLAANWPGPGYRRDRRDVRAFLAYSCRNIDQNDVLDYLFLPSNVLMVRFNTETPRRFTSPDLLEAIRRLEYSDDPENPQATAALESGLQALLKP